MGNWCLRLECGGDNTVLQRGASFHHCHRLVGGALVAGRCRPHLATGYFLGMFTCWPLVRVICSRYNSAPLRAGDHVMVLSGPQKGTTAEVYEITVGQGGWNLARLDIGQERRKKFADIFEQYALLKLNGESGRREACPPGSYA
jgi:hypothetical protein